jgi:hypothetical protein
MIWRRYFQCSLLWCSVVSSEALTLMCHQPNFTCPGNPVSCECQGVLVNVWRVFSTATSSQVFSFDTRNANTFSSDGYTAAICDNSARVLTSKLNFSLSESVEVQCVDNNHPDPARATLQVSSKRLATL